MASYKSLPQLLLEFPDNDTALIRAIHCRNFLVTSFGFRSLIPPTANNDNVDTAGIGTEFSIGSVWINTNAQTWYVCVDDRPTIAVWRLLGNASAVLPIGGSTGQALLKASSADYDTIWVTIPAAGIPTGGTTGQVLTKTSGVDYAVAWDDVPVPAITEIAEYIASDIPLTSVDTEYLISTLIIPPGYYSLNVNLCVENDSDSQGFVGAMVYLDGTPIWPVVGTYFEHTAGSKPLINLAVNTNLINPGPSDFTLEVYAMAEITDCTVKHEFDLGGVVGWGQWCSWVIAQRFADP